MSLPAARNSKLCERNFAAGRAHPSRLRVFCMEDNSILTRNLIAIWQPLQKTLRLPKQSATAPTAGPLGLTCNRTDNSNKKNSYL